MLTEQITMHADKPYVSRFVEACGTSVYEKRTMSVRPTRMNE